MIPIADKILNGKTHRAQTVGEHFIWLIALTLCFIVIVCLVVPKIAKMQKNYTNLHERVSRLEGGER